MTWRCHFLAPDPRGPISGGNVYNLGLLNALRAAGVDARLASRDVARPEGPLFVDSLYLDDLPRFAPCHLVAHYLPSLVAGRPELSPAERAALVAADTVVAPSAFMAGALQRLAPEPRRVVVVAPGIDVDHAKVRAKARAIVVANLVVGKGVLPLLEALSRRPLALTIVGRLDVDPEYVAACRAAAPGAELTGALAHRETIAEIAASDFLVSASHMESYGLALAEARALGVPIVARAGGNAYAHVDDAAGGRLVDTVEALADECLRLANDRAELERRRRAALSHRPPPRTWADAARDFVAAFRD